MSKEMKDSGIQWIGMIPEQWDVKPLKAILAERKENNKPIKTDFILSLTMNKGVIPYSEKESSGNKSKEDLTAYKLAYPNDIVLNSMNVIVGSVGLSKYFGCVSPVYYMLYPRNADNSVRYYNNMFQSKVFQDSLIGFGNGIMMKQSESSGKLNTIRMRIPMSKLNTAMLPYPSPEEQQKITDYLDEKVSEIDNIITQTTISIEEYKKYEQALITETVTKGLNPDVEMKYSGIEWIGNIPEHWTISKIKSISLVNRGGSPRPAGDLKYYDGNIPFMKISDITKDNSKYVNYCVGSIKEAGLSSTRKVLAGTLLLTNSGATLGVPKITTIDTTFNDGIASFLNLNSDIYIEFLYYYLKSITKWYLEVASMGQGQPNLNTDIIGNTPFCFPSYEEQQQIVDNLDDKCNKIDNLIAQKLQLLTELESYKKSLIYECVTGKRELK